MKNILNKIFNRGIFLFPFFLAILVLFLSIRGVPGNPNSQNINTDYYKESGPLELSPERGRFALTYSLVEDKSVYFSVALARFITPDLGYWNGKYVSLFAPGVSMLIIPGYIVGKMLGISQVGAFSVISFFAILNMLLIKRISRALGASSLAGTLAGLVFLFATPAYTYGVDLYQHHISSFLILGGMAAIIIIKKQWLSLFIVWFLCSVSLIVDYPNLFLMFPIGLFALTRLVSFTKYKAKITANLHFVRVITLTSVILPCALFAIFNYVSYGSPLRLAGTVPYIAEIGSDGKPAVSQEILNQLNKLAEPDAKEHTPSSVGFFNTRNMLNGFYIHLLSFDRGVVVYTPVILFGFLGIYYLSKDKNRYLSLLLGVVGLNFLLYSMWGDPWGGWAFGSRYLIPSYAVMSIFLSFALTKLSSKLLFIIPFTIVLIYSIFVNTLGALTTSAIPPKIQAESLQLLSGKTEKYSFDRNWDFLNSYGTKAYSYGSYFYKKMTPRSFYFMFSSIISMLSISIIIISYFKTHKNKSL